MKKSLLLFAMLQATTSYALTEAEAIDLAKQYTDLTVCGAEITEVQSLSEQGYFVAWDASGCDGGSGAGIAQGAVIRTHAFGDHKVSKVIDFGRFMPEQLSIKGDKLSYEDTYFLDSDANCCPTGRKTIEVDLFY